MRNKYMVYVIAVAVTIALVYGFGSTTSARRSVPVSSKSFKDYSDHAFNVRAYVQGMRRGARNVLIWQDPSVNLSKYRSVHIVDFGGQLLPPQNVFSYDTFVGSFNANFQGSLKLHKENSQDALLIEGAVVECNPGSRGARMWVGFGAGKAGGAVVCEVYEPNKSEPCMRIYVRDTASSGNWGGNSLSMLNHIFFSVAQRLSRMLEVTIGH